MGDEGFDPCECMWSHELAMRRLLSLLRQSQAYCTDSECLDEMPGSLPPENAAGNSFVMLMVCWMVLALLLYFLRPSSMKDRGDIKPNGPGQDSSQPPPTPPAIQ